MKPFILACIIASISSAASAQPPVLLVGSTSTLTGNVDSPKEKAARSMLHRYIKDEIGLTNEIAERQDWDVMMDRLAKGECHVSIFQGFEFAWAQEKDPKIKALALGVNSQTYPVVCVLVRQDSTVADFGGLKGKQLMMSITNLITIQLFIDRSCEARGTKADAFFSKITLAQDIESALDDLVDGKAQAVVVDETTREAYKRRKPGRSNQLKEAVRSQPFPPLVLAYYESKLDNATLGRIKNGLLSAASKDKGDMLLTFSRLSAFEAVPGDFGDVLSKTRKAYPVKPVK